jgi:hypothetical protein
MVHAIPLRIQHLLLATVLLTLLITLSDPPIVGAFHLLALISISLLVAFWKAFVNNERESWPRWPLRRCYPMSCHRLCWLVHWAAQTAAIQKGESDDEHCDSHQGSYEPQLAFGPRRILFSRELCLSCKCLVATDWNR